MELASKKIGPKRIKISYTSICQAKVFIFKHEISWVDMRTLPFQLIQNSSNPEIADSGLTCLQIDILPLIKY